MEAADSDVLLLEPVDPRDVDCSACMYENSSASSVLGPGCAVVAPAVEAVCRAPTTGCAGAGGESDAAGGLGALASVPCWSCTGCWLLGEPSPSASDTRSCSASSSASPSPSRLDAEPCSAVCMLASPSLSRSGIAGVRAGVSAADSPGDSEPLSTAAPS